MTTSEGICKHGCVKTSFPNANFGYIISVYFYYNTCTRSWIWRTDGKSAWKELRNNCISWKAYEFVYGFYKYLRDSDVCQRQEEWWGLERSRFLHRHWLGVVMMLSQWEHALHPKKSYPPEKNNSQNPASKFSPSTVGLVVTHVPV